MTKTLFLPDVLFVPSFPANRLSISKLLKAFNFCCLFTKTHCFLHELLNWLVWVKENRGIYHFLHNTTSQPDNENDASANTLGDNFQSSCSSTQLWNYRLGDPSYPGMFL